MTSNPELSILIPTWNSLPLLRLCLESLARHSQLPSQVVVHVNEGADGTLDWVREYQVCHTYTPQNVGICKAVNLAASRAVAPYLVYLNDDMYVLPGWDRALVEAARSLEGERPAYVSGTMVQSNSMAPSVVLADYGSDPANFDESRLLSDFRAKRLFRPDWSGATWPPSCVHRRWWDQVGGYSEDSTVGFYSDIDFSMKLWHLGCRRFRGVGNSLVYHFGEKTTSLVRGAQKRNVKDARIQFLRKWGILPSTFLKHYLRAGEPYQELPSMPDWRHSAWERWRLRFLTLFHGAPENRAA